MARARASVYSASAPADTAPHIPDQPDFQWCFGPAVESQPAVKTALIDLFREHRDFWAFNANELGNYTDGFFEIPLDTDDPITCAPYRFAQVEEGILKSEVQELFEAGLIEPCKDPFFKYSSPALLPPKKDDNGEYTKRRLCVDSRRINEHTVPDAYAMPRQDDIFVEVRGNGLFSTLDLMKGFNQITIKPEDRPKTAFWGPGRVLYQWIRMPFGLRNAPAAFQRVMDRVLAGLSNVRCYIDDLLVYTTWDADDAEACGLRHVEKLRELIVRLKSKGLRASPRKCRFGFLEVDFLGHRLSERGISPQHNKVEAVHAVPTPKNVSEIRSFLGLASYYRIFIEGFSSLAKPLNDLLRKNTTWSWGAEQQTAFDALKGALTSDKFMWQPDFDRPFILQTDWSANGMGAVLSQLDDQGRERVVAYASKSCTPAESRYCSYDGELLAVVWAVDHFRYYLLGHKFTVVTDHQPLIWLMKSPNLSGKHARWAIKLQEYNFSIKHRPGVENPGPDCLSRLPNSSHSYPAETSPDIHEMAFPVPAPPIPDEPLSQPEYDHIVAAFSAQRDAYPPGVASALIQPARAAPVPRRGLCRHRPAPRLLPVARRPRGRPRDEARAAGRRARRPA